MAVARVEFTVEPFEAGAPGPHVTAAVAAAERHGAAVDVGPFGSSVDVPESVAAAVVHDIVQAALANGATRIALQVERAPA
jgi:hypothetical protein